MRQASLLVLTVALSTASCATIMHGTKQDIGISSTPTNAKVTIDNVSFGNTPVIASLKRGDNHIVKIELAGYRTFEAFLTKKTSNWVWGNLVFGGLIGLAVDALTGGLYYLTPQQIASQLALQGTSAKPTANGIYVVLVREVDLSWLRIGTLSPE